MIKKLMNYYYKNKLKKTEIKRNNLIDKLNLTSKNAN